MSHLRLPASQIICPMLCLIALLAHPAFASSSTSTPEELQQMFNQGQYSQMLAKLNATLATKTSDADKATRYTLLMLKGEALLRTKASESAMDAFKAAALAGADDKEISLAHANAALIKRSSLGKYQPRTKVTGGTSNTTAAAAPIDIVDPLSRKFAFQALFTDLYEPAKPEVDRAEKMTTLPPIIDVVTSLGDLRPVEIGGTDSDTQSKELLKQLSDHASNLMTTALKNLDAQVKTIGKDATKRQKQDKLRGSDLSQSLSPQDISGLDSIASQAAQIGSAAVSMQVTFGDGETFKSVESDAKQTIDSVNKLLKQYKRPAAN